MRKVIKNVLLLEPDFPVNTTSKNHKDFLPIGLLKIASFLREHNIKVTLRKYDGRQINDEPEQYDIIMVSSLFTYWAKYVKEAVKYCKENYPDTPILVGGIYASLMPDHCKEYTKCDKVITGQIIEAETVEPAYDLVDVDYQIIHTTRGCTRNCKYCGAYKIEPEWKCKKSIKNEIMKKKIVFYDNNLLANPYIENILYELITLKGGGRISFCESQCGFDGRILLQKPHLARMLKKAGFKHPRIAWDGKYAERELIKRQIDLFVDAGFQKKEIMIFMLFNYDLSYEELEKKRVDCFKWGVQISHNRFRPLDSTKDDYNPRKKEQTSEDYYIHPNWTDAEIRQFSRNVRRQNICIRFSSKYHSSLVERKKLSKDVIEKYRYCEYDDLDKSIITDAWNPNQVHII